MVDLRASCFLLKNFFRHIHEHCRYLSLFCFSDTFGFLVNGSWSHDKLSAPNFVPCCTENISIIEIDHSLHCYHWIHFTKQLWEKVPTTTRHNYYCSFTKPDQFFFRRNWDSFFLFDMATPPRKKFLIKLTRQNADGQNVHHQRVTQTVQAGHPCERCRANFVVLSSPSERPETELFQCRCSLGVCVTEDSSIKNQAG